MRVLFSVTQRELLEARKQAHTAATALLVQLRLADGSLYPEKGKLDFLDVTVDPKTDGQIVRAVFDNKNDALTDGQTVRVVLETEKPPSVVAVPKPRSRSTRPAPMSSWSTTRTWSSSAGSRPARRATACWPSRRA